MKKILSSLLLLIIILSGCTKQEQADTIITTVKPLTDITQRIVGDDYEVKSVFPENSDPHHFELTAKNMQSIADSQMFIYISDTNNNFSANLKKSGDYQTTFVNVTEDTNFKNNVDSSLYGDSSEADAHEHEGEEVDEHEAETHISGNVILNPHVWLSPQKLMLITDVITSNVSTLNPDHAKMYQENAKDLKQELTELDKEYQEFAKKQKYPMIVAHDSAGYLTNDYGIETIGLYDLSHESEPTAKEIEGYIKQINEEHIPVIYVEQNDMNNKLITQIANETNIEIKVFNNLSTGSNDTDTLTILNENLTALKALE